ncbi:D-Ala-D-Ala carboxypeptidase [Mycolicibacterium goodii]|uniref:D-Ala-D-Ala carboxypeptidase n=1 Tax=Mycolicibacterium goodii TaxID=134601 RepID=A0A0K0XGF6_MYCGD|nr:D-Ala-D-Ala carboxypeptidase [Mycolicibacterium goodii]
MAAASAGCSTSPDAAEEAFATTEPPALETIDPAHLQSAVADAAKSLGVPGALVLLQTPQGRFVASTGTTELGAQTPPQPDTHFRIASNTKTMTAALIMLLAQDGKLSLDDPIAKYLPGVPNGDTITLSDLLRMRSGLYCYTDDSEFAAALDADPAKSWTPQEVLDIAFAHPPTAEPDTAYQYCNTNYALLGVVAEQVGGRPLAEQFQQRLFEPLGMRNTLLPAPADATEIPAPYSHGYMYGETFYAMIDEPYPAAITDAARAGTLTPIDYTHQNSSYATAAGGAISTADDLITWMRALVGGKVLDAEHQKQWLDSLLPEDPDNPEGGQSYGYGISFQRFGPDAAMYYHGGEMPGFNSFMGFDPDNDVALVIWTNLTLSPDNRTTANALLPVVLKEIYSQLNF